MEKAHVAAPMGVKRGEHVRRVTPAPITRPMSMKANDISGTNATEIRKGERGA